MLADHGIDYRIATSRDVGDIDLFTVDLFDELNVGSRSATGRGLLLVIDPAQDLVRLEVGYALEGIFPDAFVAYVQHRQMVPFFRSKRLGDGILATTELIIDRVLRSKSHDGGLPAKYGSRAAAVPAPLRMLRSAPAPIALNNPMPADMTRRQRRRQR